MRKKIINLRESWSLQRTLLVGITSVILTTLAIRASDRFFTASVKEAADFQKCPPEMVFITSEEGGFCIDKYENSPGSDCPFSNPQSSSETRVNLADDSCYPISVKGALPWRNISQNQAALACAKVNKRLATNKEWLQAALGTPDISTGWEEEDCQVNENWDQQPGFTGSGQRCVSPAGVYDMIGNVWEWVNGTVFDGLYEDRPLPEQGFVCGVDSEGLPYETDFEIPNFDYNEDYFWIRHQGTRGIFRGGYWDSGSDAGVYSTYVVVPPSFSGIGVGFRCVK